MDIIKKLEKEILEVANFLWENRKAKFDEISISIEKPFSVESGGDNDHYFSEIEIDLFRGENLITCFSIIIFMEGRQILSLEEAHSYILNEFEVAYTEYLLM